LFASATRNHLQNGHNQLNYISQGIAVQSKFIVKSNLTQNLNMQERLSAACNAIFKTGMQKIEQLESNVKNMDPVNVLKRGFSITMLNGKAVTNIEDVEIDTILQTQVLGGLIESKVSKTIKNHE
jgi:exodeoxyribonuclease VII large subunit